MWSFGVLCWEVATNIDIPYQTPECMLADDSAVGIHVMQGGQLPRQVSPLATHTHPSCDSCPKLGAPAVLVFGMALLAF